MELIRHAKICRNTSGRKDFVCANCDQTFTNEAKLLKHNSIEHKPKEKSSNVEVKKKIVFRCVLCDMNFWSRQELREHGANVHLETKEYFCEICKHSFRYNWDLKRHTRQIHMKKVEKAEEKSSKENEKGEKAAEETENVGGKNDATNTNGKRTQIEEKKFIDISACAYCGMLFTNSEKLQSHVENCNLSRNANSNEDFEKNCQKIENFEKTCGICDVTFVSDVYFEFHLKKGCQKRDINSEKSSDREANSKKNRVKVENRTKIFWNNRSFKSSLTMSEKDRSNSENGNQNENEIDQNSETEAQNDLETLTSGSVNKKTEIENEKSGTDGQFPCGICKSTFHNFKCLEDHFNKEHKQVGFSLSFISTFQFYNYNYNFTNITILILRLVYILEQLKII